MDRKSLTFVFKSFSWAPSELNLKFCSKEKIEYTLQHGHFQRTLQGAGKGSLIYLCIQCSPPSVRSVQKKIEDSQQQFHFYQLDKLFLNNRSDEANRNSNRRSCILQLTENCKGRNHNLKNVENTFENKINVCIQTRNILNT